MTHLSFSDDVTFQSCLNIYQSHHSLRSALTLVSTQHSAQLPVSPAEGKRVCLSRSASVWRNDTNSLKNEMRRSVKCQTPLMLYISQPEEEKHNTRCRKHQGQKRRRVEETWWRSRIGVEVRCHQSAISCHQ